MTSAAWKWGIGIVAAMVLSGLLIFFLYGDRKTPEQQANSLYGKARLLAAEGKLQNAENLARQAVQLNDKLAAAYFLAARCAASRGDYPQALNDLSHVTDNESDDWFAARQLAADILHYSLYRFREAERAYSDILAVKPGNVFANDGYARLLALCGRRSEAIPHVLRLIQAGEETNLLILLSRESGALSDPDALEKARTADPTDPNPLLGQGQAADSAQNPARALGLLREASVLDGLPKDFHGRLGRQLLANGRFDELKAWREDLSKQPASFETWLVLGELAELAKNPRGAIRCYWEAVKLRPESLSANNQLAQKLTAENQAKQAEKFLDRVRQLNVFRERQQIPIMSNQQPSFSEVFKMIQAYRAVGRLWEALAWSRMASLTVPDNVQLLQLRQELEARLPNLPLILTAPEYNPAHQIDLSHYPVPILESVPTRKVARSTSKTSDNISFQQRGAEIGFDFQYFDGTPGTTYRMFEFVGGGIAIIDFDNDGAPDVFCTQGRTWGKPATESHQHFDRLFHNRGGQSFLDISQHVGVALETGFGQGVSVGDVNNDGFPDLYVATTGTNTVWLNNGDGTFTDHSAALKDQSDHWTTSCLVADLNGDSIPDLYDVNYLAGRDVFDRLCDHELGEKVMCLPQNFEPAMDRVWLGDGAGGFQDKTAEFLSPLPKGRGLGIAAMNMGDNRLSLFVANDTTANFFYTLASPEATSLTETAQIAGLAFNGEGKAEACMGIAVGDCTQDGRLDFLVTNFLHESNTLYSPFNQRLFKDMTRELGLHAATLPVLGFGAQFLDANLDGRLELFVANGYTHDLSKYKTPYKMSPQLFEWTGTRFQQLRDKPIGDWSREKFVGRAVARLDWNLDGKPDLAVGLLDAPSFILTNTSRTTGNHFVTLQLVATESARDAIGVTITASVGESTWVHQLTAGDGYQCVNERKIQIGCGPNAQIDRLRIVWPSGTEQEFADVAASRSLILVEGRDLLTGDID